MPDADAALAGARDIVAEIISEDPESRSAMRDLYVEAGVVRTRVLKGKEEAGAKFRDYFDWAEPVRRVRRSPHAGHAPGREGEDPEHARLPPEEAALAMLKQPLRAQRQSCGAPGRSRPSRTATGACCRWPWRPRSAWS